jgi:hypothetical protein
MAAPDFSAKVAALLGGTAIPYASGAPIAKPRLSGWDVARATAGDPEAQALVAADALHRLRSGGDVDGTQLDRAEYWARQSTQGGSLSGSILLAKVLLFRAGVFTTIHLERLASEDAAEALHLLDQATDDPELTAEDRETLGLLVNAASDELVLCGITPARPDQMTAREI